MTPEEVAESVRTMGEGLCIIALCFSIFFLGVGFL